MSGKLAERTRVWHAKRVDVVAPAPHRARNLLSRGGELVRPMATDLRAVRWRAMLVGSVLALALVGLVWRGWVIAIGRHDHYAELGNRQQLRTYRVDASRGDVVDRGYIALAVTD